ncbi:MAG TPA: NAD-dependent succinate-semialdehyde dehydrogenase [Chitinophagales bacterium]|nr:NAD-dependent succinate-semialdehyde dehydrogenase [Chitinophagales bacterium]
MKYATINPVNNELIKEFPLDSFPDLDVSQQAFKKWKKLSVEERGAHLKKVAELLEKNKAEYARLITLEMGKPLKEAEYEIAKTLTAFDYYIANAPAFLKNESAKSNASKSYISFEPLGIIFSVMPWNFPFWQVFRFAVPTLMAGNVSILKHAQCVPQCALAIQQLFFDAGVPDNIFRSYFLSREDAAAVIADPRVHGVSFTGSDATGSVLAAQAGAHIKKCVLELGGNDAFIVLEDADLDMAVAGAIKSRSINSGQSCNGAKRFIVMDKVAEAFTTRLVEAVSQLKVGDPMDETTNVGPLARKDLLEKVQKQIADSVAKGANAYYGSAPSDSTGNFIAPVVLTNVKAGITSFEEEVFAPVWSVITVSSVEEAIETANNSVYGLGASIWSKDKQKAETFATELEAGNVFINDIVKSDARLPFGGVKRSGFGRELSEYGLKEFVNIKTVYVN